MRAGSRAPELRLRAKASTFLPPLPYPRHRIGGGLHPARFDSRASKDKNLEHGSRFLRLFVAVDIPHVHLGFTVPGAEQRHAPACYSQRTQSRTIGFP